MRVVDDLVDASDFFPTFAVDEVVPVIAQHNAPIASVAIKISPDFRELVVEPEVIDVADGEDVVRGLVTEIVEDGSAIRFVKLAEHGIDSEGSTGGRSTPIAGSAQLRGGTTCSARALFVPAVEGMLTPSKNIPFCVFDD